MSDIIKQIAARVMDTREALGLSEEEVASTVGIDETLYRSYENGERDIPIGFLTLFSEAFDISLASLITGEEARLSAFNYTAAGKGLHVQRHPGYEYHALAYKFMHKKCEPFHVRLSPSNEAVSMNAHIGHEFDFMLEGKLRVYIGEKTVELEPGDSVYFDAAYMHGMEALGDEDAVFLAIVM
ncbi:MAG: cupin domain-containing protein [Clostridia bacterium]|nr:cupin domain-containing protein [Clostridia bacterium]